MRRVSFGMVLPLLLAVVGVALIIVGQLDLDQQALPSLSDIPEPSSPVAVVTPTPAASQTPGASTRPKPTPSPTPIPRNWVAVQIQIKSVGINLPVRQSTGPDQDSFPPEDAAFILSQGSQPGRGTNSYIFGHAHLDLFKPLWNVQIGADVKILMSDGAVLRYVVTEVHPNVSCPDPNVSNPELNPANLPQYPLPLALKYAGPGCEKGARWTQPTDHERLTMQTSQGYNRNWGELVVVAQPTF
jgi:hypothetical protein